MKQLGMIILLTRCFRVPAALPAKVCRKLTLPSVLDGGGLPIDFEDFAGEYFLVGVSAKRPAYYKKGGTAVVVAAPSEVYELAFGAGDIVWGVVTAGEDGFFTTPAAATESDTSYYDPTLLGQQTFRGVLEPCTSVIDCSVSTFTSEFECKDDRSACAELKGVSTCASFEISGFAFSSAVDAQNSDLIGIYTQLPDELINGRPIFANEKGAKLFSDVVDLTWGTAAADEELNTIGGSYYGLLLPGEDAFTGFQGPYIYSDAEHPADICIHSYWSYGVPANLTVSEVLEGAVTITCVDATTSAPSIAPTAAPNAFGEKQPSTLAPLATLAPSVETLQPQPTQTTDKPTIAPSKAADCARLDIFITDGTLTFLGNYLVEATTTNGLEERTHASITTTTPSWSTNLQLGDCVPLDEDLRLAIYDDTCDCSTSSSTSNTQCDWTNVETCSYDKPFQCCEFMFSCDIPRGSWTGTAEETQTCTGDGDQAFSFYVLE